MKILCLGNSITHHAPSPDIGWYGDHGMAASDAEHDYVHRLSALLAEDGHEAEIIAVNIADFERQLNDYDFSKFDPYVKMHPDVFVLRIGENVPEDRIDEFYDACCRLFLLFAYTTPKMLAVSCFWKHSEKDLAIYDAACDCGVDYVDLRGLDDPMYKAIGKFEHSGVANHPGDLGMEEIAIRIRDGIYKHF